MCRYAHVNRSSTGLASLAEIATETNMLENLRDSLDPAIIACLGVLLSISALPADESPVAETSAHSVTLPPNIKRIIHHGRLLARPAIQPEGTSREVAYELGHVLQLDRDHCLVVASMDEQGGGDLCVGNDAFVV